MKAGVGTDPCGVVSVPARAVPSVASSVKEMDIENQRERSRHNKAVVERFLNGLHVRDKGTILMMADAKPEAEGKPIPSVCLDLMDRERGCIP
jgi:hypothetical protein